MTGPEHYKAAQGLLEGSLRPDIQITTRDSLIATAQVHATLALVAATASQPCQGIDGTESLIDQYDWAEAMA